MKDQNVDQSITWFFCRICKYIKVTKHLTKQIQGYHTQVYMICKKSEK